MASEILRVWIRDPLDDAQVAPGPAELAELPAQSTRQEAELRAAAIRGSLERFLRDTEDAIVQAYLHRDWAALEYASWADYVRGEFGIQRLKLPRDDRRQVATRWHLMGMSRRAIASALGASRNTVAADLAQTEPPDAVRGADGKRYPAKADVVDAEPIGGEPVVPAREVEWPPVAELGAGLITSAAPGGATSEVVDVDRVKAEDARWFKDFGRAMRRAQPVRGFEPFRLVQATPADERDLVMAWARATRDWAQSVLDEFEESA